MGGLGGGKPGGTALLLVGPPLQEAGVFAGTFSLDGVRLFRSLL